MSYYREKSIKRSWNASPPCDSVINIHTAGVIFNLFYANTFFSNEEYDP
jgi:hypothetical protein